MNALIAFVLTAGLGVLPAWQNLGPGGGGWIQSICASPHDRDELFVGCDVGGFYRSFDGGRSYKISNAGLGDYFVECIVPHPRDADTIFLGCESGVYKSTDRGRTWRWLRDGFPPTSLSRWTAPIGALVIDPEHPDTLYAGIGRPRMHDYGQGAVYKTTDGGEHWAVVNGPGNLPPDARINDLAIDPRNGQHLYLTCQHGVYQSRDGGANWRPTVTGLPHHHARRLAICPAQPDVIYVTIWTEPGQPPWQGGVHKSTDGGNHWQPCLDGLAQRLSKPSEAQQKTFNYDRLAVHPENPDIVYVGGLGWGNHKMYKTVDGGESWQSLANIVDPGWITFNGASVMCLSMSPLDPEVLYWGSSMHVFKSTDGGASWNQRYGEALPDGRIRGSGLEVTCVLNTFVHPENSKRLYFGYADIGLLVSDDAGRTFRRCVQGLDRELNEGPLSMAFDPDDPDHCWAGFGWRSTSGRAGVIAESTDGGRTWRQVGTPESGLPAGIHRALFVEKGERPRETSRSYGRQTVGSAATPPSGDGRLPVISLRLLTIASGHGVFASEDGGQTWEARNAGIANAGSVRDLMVYAQADPIYWCVTSGTPAEVYRSDDGAHTWQKVSLDLRAGDVYRLAVAPSDPQRLYLAARSKYVKGRGTFLGGVYRSIDGGITWQHVLDDRFAEGLAIDPRDADVVYAGLTDHPYHDESTGRGVVVSRDGGKSWTSLNGTGLTCKQVVCITIDPHAPDRLYLGTGGNGVFVGRVKQNHTFEAVDLGLNSP